MPEYKRVGRFLYLLSGYRPSGVQYGLNLVTMEFVNMTVLKPFWSTSAVRPAQTPSQPVGHAETDE